MKWVLAVRSALPKAAISSILGSAKINPANQLSGASSSSPWASSPDFYDIQPGLNFTPAKVMLFQTVLDFLTAGRTVVVRADPGQQPGRGELDLAFVQGERTQLPRGFFQNPSQLGLIALHEFDDATGAGWSIGV